MSTSKASNGGSNNGSCQRTVKGKVCMIFSIINIDRTGPDASFELVDSGNGPQISNQQSNKPLNSNGQSALNDALTSDLGQALADYINTLWSYYYFLNGQTFEVCADFVGTIEAESDNGPATADTDLANIDVTLQLK